jgi:hypothetical protein
MALTPEEQRELDELEYEALLAEAGEVPQAAPTPKEDEGLWGDVKAAGGKALEMAGRTLDLPGGIARTLYQGAVDIPYYLRTGNTVTKPEDYKNMLTGNAPTSEEFMARQGIEDTGGRTAVGLAKDIALDPMTYMTLGAAPLARGTAKAGKSIYKSGLKAIDLEAAKYGKEPVSDILMKEGVTGSAEQIQKRIDELAEGYKRERDYILKKADEAGGQVSMKEAMAPLKTKIDDIRASKDPALQSVADTMDEDLAKYVELGEDIKPSVGSSYKSSVYNQIPGSNYANATQTPVGKSLQKEKARGLKDAVETAVEKSTGKQNAAELKELNDKLGRMLTSRKKAGMEAAKEINKNAFTSVDAMIAGLGGDNAVKGLALKKAADIAKMTGPRTKVGKAMVDNAESLGLLQKNLLYSPWITMQRYQSTKEGDE